MNIKSAKIRAETVYIRFRGVVRTLFQFVGVGLVLVGAYNMLLNGDLFLFYRELYPQVVNVSRSTGLGFVAVADVVVIALGAALAWFA